jgi:hypothetical protein
MRGLAVKIRSGAVALNVDRALRHTDLLGEAFDDLGEVAKRIADAPTPLLLARPRDRHFFDVAGVQDHRQEAGSRLAVGILGHPVHTP